MNVTDVIIPSLQALVTSGALAEVNYGGAIAAKETQVEGTPAIFVSPLREIAGETVDIGTLRQTIEEQVQVILVAKYAEFDAAREAILGVLFGLNPYPPGEPCLAELEMVEALQIDGTATYIYWRDILAARRERRLV